MKTITKLWILILILAILAPVGLILPEVFKAGSAWGEWGPEEIKGLLGYVPAGLERLASIWNAPVPDYSFKGLEEASIFGLSAAYVACAVIGIFITALLTFFIGKFLEKR